MAILSTGCVYVLSVRGKGLDSTCCKLSWSIWSDRIWLPIWFQFDGKYNEYSCFLEASGTIRVREHATNAFELKLSAAATTTVLY